MKQTIVVCDNCRGRDLPGSQTLFVPTGRQPDGAGGPSEEVGEEIDLCPSCVAKALQRVLICDAHQSNAAFLKAFKGAKP